MARGPQASPAPGTQPEITIRAAAKDDAAVILRLIRGLAEYEKLAHEMVATEEDIARSMFGSRPYAECLLAEENGTAIGFALFFHNYSTFLGKPGLYLEDLYVEPTYRQRGIGQRFFKELGKIALQRDCGRMEWWVLDWNEPAIRFYKDKLGAKSMDEWTVQRLDRKAIERLAEKTE